MSQTEVFLLRVRASVEATGSKTHWGESHGILVDAHCRQLSDMVGTAQHDDTTNTTARSQCLCLLLRVFLVLPRGSPREVCVRIPATCADAQQSHCCNGCGIAELLCWHADACINRKHSLTNARRMISDLGGIGGGGEGEEGSNFLLGGGNLLTLSLGGFCASSWGSVTSTNPLASFFFFFFSVKRH